MFRIKNGRYSVRPRPTIDDSINVTSVVVIRNDKLICYWKSNWELNLKTQFSNKKRTMVLLGLFIRGALLLYENPWKTNRTVLLAVLSYSTMQMYEIFIILKKIWNTSTFNFLRTYDIKWHVRDVTHPMLA